MPWSPTPTAPSRVHRTAWFPEPPPPTPRQHQVGWFPRYRLTATDTGVGEDLAALLARTAGIDSGVGEDQAVLQLLTDQLAADIGIGMDTGLLLPNLTGADTGVGTDLLAGSIGIGRLADLGVGHDLAALQLGAQHGLDHGIGADLPHQIRARLPSRPTAGVGADTSTGGFTPQPPTAIIQVTATGTHQFIPIPVWCRYIDVILLGAGGGGSAGTTGFPGWSGLGGAAGQYASHRWDRGENRNDWTQLAILVGIGGSGGPSPGGDGGNGTATELWIDNDAGWAGIYLAGAGGAGASGEALIETNRPGKSPGNHSFQGINATGGTGNSSPPGSGGRGGGGSVFPLTPGSGEPGARGQAWVRFSM